MLGGATNHWTGHCYRFVTKDFEKRDWVPNSGWPIGLGDVEPYYRAAFELVTFGEEKTADWSPDSWRRQFGTSAWPLPGGRYATRVEYMAPRDPIRRSFRQYMPELEKPRNIRVISNATVTELVLDSGMRRVERVRAAGTESGRTFSIAAKTVVLACGGLENARLLLASRRQKPNGVGNDHDQVGRYFTDHVFFHQRMARSPETSSDALFRFNERPNDIRLTGHVVFQADELAREKFDDVFIRVHPAPMPDSPGVASAKRIAKGDISTDDILEVMNGLGSVSSYALGKIRGANEPDEYRLVVRIEPPPDPESRITLTGESDHLGMPKMNLHWAIAASAKTSAAKAIDIFSRDVGALGIGRVQATFDPGGEWPQDFEVGYHHCCTTRMAEQPANGVVDRNCKVFGVDNLYVAGSSVFSTAGSGSPTMTLIALALRLGDHLKERA
jgi:choline dehydrogenase-like flavoprotein